MTRLAGCSRGEASKRRRARGDEGGVMDDSLQHLYDKAAGAPRCAMEQRAAPSLIESIIREAAAR